MNIEEETKKIKNQSNDKIKKAIFVVIGIIIAGCFIPFEKEYVSDDGTPGTKNIQDFNTIEKYSIWQGVLDSDYVDVNKVKVNVIRFSNNGVCKQRGDCMAYYYFPKTKKLSDHLNRESSKISVSFSNLNYSDANIYEYSNMKCFAYGLYCPNYKDYSFKETFWHTNIKIDNDAIVKEYSTTDDCTNEDRAKVSDEYEGDMADCTKDWSKYKTIRAKDLF